MIAGGVRIFLLMYLFSVIELCAQEVFIIIPGTWADVTIPGVWGHKQTWYRPGGDFFQAFAVNIKSSDAIIIPFTWSGSNNHQERVIAGKELATLIANHDQVNIVAHSHGVNVGVIAAQILGKQGLRAKIKNFYAMACPVNITDYAPDMSVIENLFHFFSFEDPVQTVLGQFKRIFTAHPRIANIRVLLRGKGVDHHAIHDPLIGRWLPAFAELLTKAMGSLGIVDLTTPLIAHFTPCSDPHIGVDTERTELLELDAWFQHNLATAFGRKKHA